MEITTTIKNVYGSDLMYPACETAYWFSQLTGSKTFTVRHLAMIQNLGYKIVVDNNQKPFSPT